MTRTELIDALATGADLEKKQAKMILEVFTEIVQKERDKREELTSTIDKLRASLESL